MSINVAVIGVGKMGISHTAILGAHTNVNLMAICETSDLILSAFKKFNPHIRLYKDYKVMIENESIDAVFIATPTKTHFQIAEGVIKSGIHVFCEKPLSLSSDESGYLSQLAEKHKIVNQVGFHNHFVGTFMEMKRLLKNGLLGKLLHFSGEAYGPVIVRPKGGTWRTIPEEGGGCLQDYASHVLNLIQEIIGRPVKVSGTLLKKLYSKEVEDAVYANILLRNELTGTLSVNWSDETYRKMSTSLCVQGLKGKMICDATELKIYLNKENKIEKIPSGWSIKTITDLTNPVEYYLRGEEYSSQIDYFINRVINNQRDGINTFEQAHYTNLVIEMLKSNAHDTFR